MGVVVSNIVVRISSSAIAIADQIQSKEGIGAARAAKARDERKQVAVSKQSAVLTQCIQGPKASLHLTRWIIGVVIVIIAGEASWYALLYSTLLVSLCTDRLTQLY